MQQNMSSKNEILIIPSVNPKENPKKIPNIIKNHLNMLRKEKKRKQEFQCKLYDP